MLFLFFVFCLAFLMCVSIVILALYQKTKRCSYYVWAYSQWGVLLILVSIKWQLEIFFAVQEDKHTRQTHKKINKNIQGSNGKPLDLFRNSSNYFFFIEKTSYYYFSKYAKYKFMFRTHQATIHMKGESITLSTLNNFPTIMPCYFLW